MTQTAHGPRCDVCKQYILPLGGEMLVTAFPVSHGGLVLHGHEACREPLEALADNIFGDISDLMDDGAKTVNINLDTFQVTP